MVLHTSRLLRLVGVALCFGIAATAFAQDAGLDELTADDEFRWGVTAMHAGRVNEAIASFNRSLSFSPDRTLTRFWLGRAYYYAGFERAALEEWNWIAERGAATAVLNRWMERVELDQGLTRERLGTEVAPGRYVTMVNLPGEIDEIELFRRPTTVTPREDGYFYVTSFGTHRVVLLDPNGVREDVIDGGIEGFDLPFDVLLLDDGSLLVAEFGADRIAQVSPAGFKIGSFGSTGLGDGELLGPQFMELDGKGSFYVSDYGNRRVSKFTTDGEFLLSFGDPAPRFDGLLSPAGVAVLGDTVFVADTDLRRIVAFDESGNYLREIRFPMMQSPEGLSGFDDQRLLVSDGNRLYLIDVETENVSVLSEVADGRRLLGSAIDANQNLLAADHSSSAILVMAASEELYTGLNVEIDHVISAGHPNMLAAVTVTDRNGQPLLGLDESNFRITEDRFPTGIAELARAGYLDGESAVAIVVPAGSDELAVQNAVLDVYDRLEPSDRLWLLSAGELPVVEVVPPSARLATAESAAAASQLGGAASLDLGLRLAASQLLTDLGRRSVVLVSDGIIGPDAFTQYSLIETGEHLENNHIALSVIYTGDQRSDELSYLVEITGGTEVYVYAPTGARVIVDQLKESRSGSYLLSYRSGNDSDFGRRYIPIEIEAYLLERSGRDEAGYFGPLEF